jgi:hypothetical protein
VIIKKAKNAQEAIIKRMHLSISTELLRPFWAQLFQNIGYSIQYNRYVIVEPICYLVECASSTLECVPIDPLIHNFDLGSGVASLIDAKRNDDIEQALVPYIQHKKYKYILVGDNPIIFPRNRLLEFLEYLKQNSQILRKVRSLIHYHLDEPRLSEADIETITLYTREVKSLGGTNQVGIVLSEKDPEDSLKIKKSGEKEFVDHMSIKLKMRRIDVIGELFTGRSDFHAPLEIRIDS